MNFLLIVSEINYIPSHHEGILSADCYERVKHRQARLSCCQMLYLFSVLTCFYVLLIV